MSDIKIPTKAEVDRANEVLGEAIVNYVQAIDSVHLMAHLSSILIGLVRLHGCDIEAKQDGYTVIIKGPTA